MHQNPKEETETQHIYFVLSHFTFVAHSSPSNIVSPLLLSVMVVSSLSHSNLHAFTHYTMLFLMKNFNEIHLLLLAPPMNKLAF